MKPRNRKTANVLSTFTIVLIHLFIFHLILLILFDSKIHKHSHNKNYLLDNIRLNFPLVIFLVFLSLQMKKNHFSTRSHCIILFGMCTLKALFFYKYMRKNRCHKNYMNCIHILFYQINITHGKCFSSLKKMQEIYKIWNTNRFFVNIEW